MSMLRDRRHIRRRTGVALCGAEVPNELLLFWSRELNGWGNYLCYACQLAEDEECRDRTALRDYWFTWAGQFEWHCQLNRSEIPARCLYAVQEGHHRIACRAQASGRSRDGYPACYAHRNTFIRRRWKNYVRGA